MENQNVSAQQIIDEANNMEQILNDQKAASDALKASVESARTNLNAMKALDGQEINRGHVQPTDEEGNPVGEPYDPVERFKLIIEPDLDTLEKAFKDFDAAYSEYCDHVAKFKTALEEIRNSADEIATAVNEMIAALIDDKPTETDNPTETEEEDPSEEPFDGPGGGYGGGGSPETYGGSPSYAPDPTKEEEEEEKDDEDYGDGDEGNETEPTVQDPITTLTPLPTKETTTVTPTATTPSSTPTVTTPATTQQPTVTTGAAPVEQHSGGGYSGGGGYSYNPPTDTPTEEETVQEEVASSIDNIVKGKTATKIPTSSAPIAKASTTTAKSTGSSVIPAASGIAAAAVIGLGAKAFLDKKKQEEEEEEEQLL